MNKMNADPRSRDIIEQQPTQEVEAGEKPAWETPKMEDVSEQVMAQPYIRFT